MNDFEYHQQVVMPRRCRGLTDGMHDLQPIWLPAVAGQILGSRINVLPDAFLVEEARRDHIKFVRAV